MNIQDKLFTYIQNKNDLNDNILSLYKNSLIFIGDEQQIYHPLTNTYVGIGMSSYNYILNYLKTTYIVNTNSSSSYYISFVNNSTTGNYLYSYVDSNLQYNPGTNTLISTEFAGHLTGNVTGNADSANGLKQSNITNSLSAFTHNNYLIYGSALGGNSIEDKPNNVDAFGVISMKTADGWYGQILISSNTSSGIYWRTATTLSNSWNKILDTNNTKVVLGKGFINDVEITNVNNAINATNANISNYSYNTYTAYIINTNNSSSYYISFVNTSTIGNYSYTYVDANLQYNPGTNTLMANLFSGQLDPSLQWGTI